MEPLELAAEQLGTGPCMRRLTPMQRQYVLVKCTNPNWSNTACAEAAGYAGNPGTLRMAAVQLEESARVRAAIKEVTEAQFDSKIPMARNVLIEIMEDESAKKDLRVKAAMFTLGRAGINAETVIRNIHEVDTGNQTRAELLAAITALAGNLRLDPTKLVEHKPKPEATDAEFVEITPAFDAEEWKV